MTLSGWLATTRRFGRVVFARLRDASGEVQVVADAGTPQGAAAAAALAALPDESVVRVSGQLRPRPQEERRPAEGPLGSTELAASCVEALNEAVAPLPIASAAARAGGAANATGHEKALRWRHLELRAAPALRRNLETRARAAAAARRFLGDESGFLEVETPTLFRPTPEGAREFVVPCRTQAGRAYALPQSPQQYKQLLIAAGIERYFQVARCYRDELGRADRQPEFTQVDLEAAFASEEDIMRVLEGLVRAMWAAAGHALPERPFERMAYRDAMLRFGNDKPDLRLEPWAAHDVTAAFSPEADAAQQQADGVGLPAALAEAAAAGGAVWAFAARGAASALSRSALKRTIGELSVATLAVAASSEAAPELSQWSGPLARRIGEGARRRLTEALDVSPGDTLVLAAAPTAAAAAAALSEAREALLQAVAAAGADTMACGGAEAFRMLFVVDFPLFEASEDAASGVSPAHHPFTAPAAGHVDALRAGLASGDTQALLACRSRAYDLVCNGVELGGGSVRIHDAALQRQVLRSALGMDSAAAEASFGHLLAALSHGCPPHAGAALGLDRAVALLAAGGAPRAVPIRDVIAFPKSVHGNEPLTGAPAALGAEVLGEYGLQSIVADDSKKAE